MTRRHLTCVACINRERGFCGAVVASSETGNSELHATPLRTARRGEQIFNQNRVCGEVFVLCEGWAFHFVRLRDGRRQILRFLLPGDLLSPMLVIKARLEFSTEALTDVQLNGFRRAEIQNELPTDARLTHALYEAFGEELSEATALVAVLGQYSAEERIAYLILNLTRRISARSVIQDERYRFPLRQHHIADSLGLTAVHVSRTIRSLRDRGLIRLSDGVLEIYDRPELERIGQRL